MRVIRDRCEIALADLDPAAPTHFRKLVAHLSPNPLCAPTISAACSRRIILGLRTASNAIGAESRSSCRVSNVSHQECRSSLIRIREPVVLSWTQQLRSRGRFRCADGFAQRRALRARELLVSAPSALRSRRRCSPSQRPRLDHRSGEFPLRADDAHEGGVRPSVLDPPQDLRRPIPCTRLPPSGRSRQCGIAVSTTVDLAALHDADRCPELRARGVDFTDLPVPADVHESEVHVPGAARGYLIMRVDTRTGRIFDLYLRWRQTH